MKQDVNRDDVKKETGQQRRRVWARRIILAALLAIVLAIGGGQIVLWSDLPRQVVVASLQRQLGLRVAAESLSTGWFGRTSLRNVTASLPLSNEALLTMPVMRVTHTSLLGMIVGKSMRLHRIELQNPTLIVRQSPAGRWNALEAIDLIARTAGRRQAQLADRSARILLPAVRVERGTLRIIDQAGREASIGLLSASGEPRGPLVWRFDVKAEQRLVLSGEVVPGGLWQHEAKIALAGMEQWIRPFIPEWPENSHAQLHWRGQRDGDAVRGRLQIDVLSAGDWGASGLVAVSGEGSKLALQPQGVLVQTAQPLLPEVRLVSGSIELDGPTLRASNLRLSGAGGEAEVSGSWNPGERSAAIEAAWHDLQLPRAVAQSGELRASLQSPWPGRPKVQATLLSSGSIDLGRGSRWDAQLDLSGEGENLRDMNWTATFPKVVYEDHSREISLPGLVVRGSTRGDVVSLDDLTLPPERGQLAGRGQIDLERRQWWLWLRGGDFAAHRAPQAAVKFDVNTWGSFDYLHIENAWFAAAEADLSITGFYDRHLPKPLVVTVWLTHLPPHMGEEQSPLLRGRLRSGVQLSGTVAPLDLALAGDLYGRDVFIQSHSLGDIAARLDGRITSQWVRVNTRQLKLLGGQWTLDGYWPADPGKSFELNIDVSQLPLAEVGDLVGIQHLSGTAGGQFELKIPKLRRDEMTMDGAFTAEQIAREPLRAERASGRVSLRGGVLRVHPLELHEQDGRTVGLVQLELRRPTHWRIAGAAQRWPLRLAQADASFVMSGETNLDVDLSRRTFHGDVHLSSDITRAAQQIGTATIDLSADGRVLHAQRIDAALLGGTLAGTAALDLDAPLRTTAQITWRDLDGSAVASLIPRFKEFSGLWNGELIVAPSDEHRALGPLHLGLTLQSPDGRFGALAVNSLQVSAFANISKDNPDQSKQQRHPERWRIVTQSASASVADGEANIFARLTRRRDGTLSAQTMVQFERLNLDQLVHAAAPDADPMPGLLSGSLNLSGDPRNHRAVFGDVNLSLDQTDLVNFDPVGFLYDLMRVGGRRGGPEGTGRLAARIENESVQISSAYLFNRGVEVRGAGSIRQVFNLPHSPVEGMLVGTARPLKDLRLPFMADVDQIFSVLQSNATTVEVTGTLREPRMRATTLDEVNETLRALLLGDVQRETRRR